MARLFFTATNAEQALAAATTETILQVVAPANQRVVVVKWAVYFDGISVTAEPIVVELGFQADAGTSSALTPQLIDGSLSESIQSTARSQFTGEPASTTVIERLNVHPQSGFADIQPLMQEFILGGGDRFGIRVTAPAVVNAIGFMKCEE
jgi:hypothetical protein